MALGVRDLKDLALPSGWDGAYLAKQALQDGTTYEQVVNSLASAVVAFNSSLISHPWLPMLTSPTERNTVRYRSGASDAWENHTEYKLPDAGRASMTGHMLPREKYDKGIGWTWDYLNDAILEDVTADIRVFLDTGLDLFEREALQRLFKAEAVTVGSSGSSPPVADASATLTFTPPDYMGQSFASTHTHLLRYGTSAHGQAAGAMAAHLKEHGHIGPYEMIISDADKTTWASVSDATYRVYFRNAQRTELSYGNDTTLASPTVDPEMYFGLLDTPSGVVYLRSSYRVPTNYAAMYKPYGANDPRNPLRWWYNSRFGPGLTMISADKIGFPVQRIIGYAEFGFGIGADRTNGVLVEFDSAGSYATPTIT